MSKQIMFSVFDCKAEAYLPPFIAPTVEVAKRMFTAAARDPQHQFAQFADDYTLFEIANWDDAVGKVEMHRAAISHGLALHYRQAAQLAELDPAGPGNGSISSFDTQAAQDARISRLEERRGVEGGE